MAMSGSASWKRWWATRLLVSRASGHVDHSLGERDALCYCPGRLGLLAMKTGPGRGLRMMGGGPRTFPGGVSKWQWKRMQEKKQQQIERARLLRDRQLYEARRRAELMAACPKMEKPWEVPMSVPPPPQTGDPHIKALASRFNKGGAVDLWTEFDGPLYSDDDERPSSSRSARILPRSEALSAGSGFAKPSSREPKKRVGNNSSDPMAPAPGALQMDGIHPQQAKRQYPAGEAFSPSHLSQTRFDSFPISPLSIQALHYVLKYEMMTIVQERTLPVILEGVDLLAKAKTGTGKTIAFLLPCIEAILKSRSRQQQQSGNDWPISVLVVCPTRELASQAAVEATLLTKFHLGIGSQVVIGGTNRSSEVARLNKLPCQLLVGTPGRLVDHIQSSSGFARRLQGLKVLVLDEADQLLEMGFRKSLDAIIAALPKDRQTLLFSATIPKEVHSMKHVALKKTHVFVDTVGEEEDTHTRVDQSVVIAPLEQQLAVSSAILSEHIAEDPNFKVLVFCTTARLTQLMAELFQELGLNIREIHSRKSQAFRTRTSDEFRRSTGGIIMFTSDVSARGVDYPDVSLVLQIGLPAGRQQYIHRLGRTGRAGKGGRGILLLTPWEQGFVKELHDIPLSAAAVPVVTADCERRIRHALTAVSKETREKAYIAWLGYYNSVVSRTWDKETLVQRANVFSSSIGLASPPGLARKLVQMMGLKGVLGLNIA